MPADSASPNRDLVGQYLDAKATELETAGIRQIFDSHAGGANVSYSEPPELSGSLQVEYISSEGDHLRHAAFAAVV